MTPRSILLVLLSSLLDWSAGQNVGHPAETDNSSSSSLSSAELPCQFASLQCSYRTGCGRTLKSYMLECRALIDNETEVNTKKKN